MPYFEKQNIISGSLIVDGTIQAEQIAANTITANKFSGAVEEEYWSYVDDKDISFAYSGYTTVLDFTFPKTELDIFKGRHVSYCGEAYMNTSTSTQYDGFLYLRLEAEVPSVQTATSIGNAKHVSFPETNYQLVYWDGNVTNKIGSGGTIGTQGGNHRLYTQVYYDKNTQGSELITNGNFNTGTSNWTLGAGSHSSGYGAYSLSAASDGDGFSYQAITTVVGQEYTVSANVTNGNIAGIIRASNAADLVENTTINTSGGINSVQAVSFTFVAESTTTYIILATSASTSSSDYRGFDNISVKQQLPRTYAKISTTGGQLCPTDGTATSLWFHPYSGASSGTYQLVDFYIQKTRTKSYTNYFRFQTEAYIGWFNDDIKLRLTCLNQIAFGKTVTLNNVKIFMQSRIVE